MTVHIAPFQPENLDSICELEKQNLSKDTALPKEQLYDILAHPDIVAYCLKNGKTIIGYIILKIEKIKGWMDIISIAIEKKYRRKGWGEKTLLFSQEISRSIKLDALIVQLNQKNKIAVSFFHKLGFEITKEFDGYLTENEKGYEMKLELTQQNSKNTLQ